MRLKQGRKRRNLKILLLSLLFIGPNALAYLIFSYYTNLQSLFFSLFSFDYGNPPGVFIGLKNYIAVLSSSDFWAYLWNTVVLFFFSVIFAFWVPIAQALVLSELTRGKKLARYLYVLPASLPAIASMTIWIYIWNVDYGLANRLVGILGLGPYDWLGDPKLVKMTLRIGGLLGGGLGILIYLVSINNISEDIYEAAKIDGATAFRRIFAITLPNMKNIIGLQFLLSLSGALLTFDDVYIMTGGGPGESSRTIVMGIYLKAFSQLNYGQAMAMSVLLCLITMIFVGLQLKLRRARED